MKKTTPKRNGKSWSKSPEFNPTSTSSKTSVSLTKRSKNPGNPQSPKISPCYFTNKDFQDSLVCLELQEFQKFLTIENKEFLDLSEYYSKR